MISSSDTVEGRRGVHSRGAFIDGFYLLRGRSFEEAFIQSITVIRTCFIFWILYAVFQCHLFPIQIKLFVYLNYLSFKK